MGLIPGSYIKVDELSSQYYNASECGIQEPSQESFKFNILTGNRENRNF